MVPAQNSDSLNSLDNASLAKAEFLPPDHMEKRYANPKSIEHVKLLRLCAQAIESTNQLLSKWSETDLFNSWPERRTALYSNCQRSVQGLRDYLLMNRRNTIFGFDPELRADSDRLIIKSQACLQILSNRQSIGDNNFGFDSASSNSNLATFGELKGAIMLVVYDASCDQ